MTAECWRATIVRAVWSGSAASVCFSSGAMNLLLLLRSRDEMRSVVELGLPVEAEVSGTVLSVGDVRASFRSGLDGSGDCEVRVEGPKDAGLWTMILVERKLLQAALRQMLAVGVPGS